VKFPLDIAAVAFDLDGTLVDTLPDLHEAGNRMLADLGRAAVGVERVRGFIGDGVDRLVKRLLTGAADGEPDDAHFQHARERFGEHYWQVLTRASKPYPGVPAALDAMRERGLKLACVTNKPERFTLRLLKELDLLSRLDRVIAGDTLPRKKPDPMPFLHCAREFGVATGLLLVVGDSANDCAAARAAGCPVFCVPYGYRGPGPVQSLDCDAIVPAVSDCVELIRPVRS
jgi:phosphoglycolate phosphatase